MKTQTSWFKSVPKTLESSWLEHFERSTSKTFKVKRDAKSLKTIINSIPNKPIDIKRLHPNKEEVLIHTNSPILTLEEIDRSILIEAVSNLYIIEHNLRESIDNLPKGEKWLFKLTKTAMQESDLGFTEDEIEFYQYILVATNQEENNQARKNRWIELISNI